MMIRILVPLGIVPAALVAQSPTPADSYEPRYAEVLALAPRADRVAAVNNLVLRRDVARFTLASGTVYLLSTVGGRTVGAAFQGRGTLSFSPPTPIEQDRLARFQKTRALDTPIDGLVLLFADTTLAELEGKLRFGAGSAPADIRDLVKRALDRLGDDDEKALDPDLMAALLNGDASDLFYAHIERTEGGPLMFMVNPFEFEGVTLATPQPRTAWSPWPEVICKFPRQGTAPAAVAGERFGTATIGSYRMDVTLTQTGSGD